MTRFTAEYRGGDRGEKPWEWCIIDEEQGWCGSSVIFDLTEDEAKALARKMNEEENHLVEDTWAPPQQYRLEEMGYKGWELVDILREKHNGSAYYTVYGRKQMNNEENLCPSCREPLDHPSGEGCANMTKHKGEPEVSDEESQVEGPFYIMVDKITENEDGGATYTFEMSHKATHDLAQHGLELILYCGAYKVDIQDVYNWIATKGENNANEPTT